MPEIGATLRDARMRARIDISEIEAETKIRAKYLRALENEEWALLPGPAYVRSFLRTYAEALDLDAKLLLEEYKLRHERPSDHDLMPIGSPRRRISRGGGGPGLRQRPGRRVPPGIVLVIVVVIGLLTALYALGKTANNDSGGGPSATTTRTSRTTTTPVPKRTTTAPKGAASKSKKRKRSTATTSRLARLQVVPSGQGPVYVCLEAAGGRRPLNGVTLQPGSTSGIYRSSQFKLRLGNGNASLRLNGKLRKVANASPVAYIITRRSFKRVNVNQTPSCG